MAVTADKPAPYAPPRVILELIDRHRSRGLPAPVDADVLARASVSDSLLSRTLQALQTLDLIDETGKPTDSFEGIRLAPEAEYQKRLEEWLRAVYAEVFSFVDPTKDNETAVRDAFRSYKPIGQQPRMVSLFMGLCAAAGLMGEKPAPARPQPRSQPRTRKPASQIRKISRARPTASGIPAPLAGLLDSLPNDQEGWTKSDRDRFMTTFGTVLDFCYPVLDEKEISESFAISPLARPPASRGD